MFNILYFLNIDEEVVISEERFDCPLLYVPVGDLCLSFVTWAKVGWDEAKQLCHSMDGKLAHVLSANQLREIYLYLHKEGKIYR